MTEGKVADITITASDGGKFQAYLAMPKRTPAPALVLLQEVYGVNRFMKRISDYWASQGFIAASPDVYWRFDPNNPLDPETPGHREKARAKGAELDVDKAVEDITTLVEHLRRMPECTGKVGTSGYCLGGKLAYLQGTRGTADCNVSYYGVGIEKLLGEAGNLRKPLMLHMGEIDSWTPLEVRKQLDGVLSGFAHVTSYVYPKTDHAFAREGASTDVPAMRELANGRTLEFLRQHLG
jgi:carboxymethylenebutenolidase